MTAWPETLPRPTALRDEELAEYDATRRLTAERLAAAAAAGPEGRLDRALIAALAGAGLVQRLFPASHGGSQPGEVSAVTLCLLREAVAVESPEAETALAMQGLGAYPVLQSGRAELARRWIPEIATGRAVPAFALTEPGAGSDAAALELAAEPDGDGWRLTGEKTWISNAPEADLYSVFARTTPGAGAARRHRFRRPRRLRGAVGQPARPARPRTRSGRSPSTGCRARRPRARRARPGLRRGDAHPRPVPAVGGRLRRRDGAGGAGSGHRPRRGSARRSVARCATCRRWATSSPRWRRRCTAPGCWSTTRPGLRHRGRAAHRSGRRWPSWPPPRWPSRCRRRRPDPRRPRPRARPPARTAVPRRPRPPDLRGRLRGPTDDHRPPPLPEGLTTHLQSNFERLTAWGVFNRSKLRRLSDGGFEL